jgi:hypothetical protein
LCLPYLAVSRRRATRRSPAIVKAAVDSRLPYGLTASSFSELPILWEEQLHLAS